MRSLPKSSHILRSSSAAKEKKKKAHVVRPLTQRADSTLPLYYGRGDLVSVFFFFYAIDCLKMPLRKWSWRVFGVQGNPPRVECDDGNWALTSIVRKREKCKSQDSQCCGETLLCAVHFTSTVRQEDGQITLARWHHRHTQIRDGYKITGNQPSCLFFFTTTQIRCGTIGFFFPIFQNEK